MTDGDSGEENKPDEGTVVAYENRKDERNPTDIKITGDSVSQRSIDIDVDLRPWQWFLITIIVICIFLTVVVIVLPEVVRSVFQSVLVDIMPFHLEN